MSTEPINPADEEMQLNNESDWKDDEEYPEEAREHEEEDFVDWGDSDDDDDDDPFERAMDDCGQIHGGGCMLAGTEDCDFECPFSRQMYENMNRKRDSKGRFTK